MHETTVGDESFTTRGQQVHEQHISLLQDWLWCCWTSAVTLLSLRTLKTVWRGSNLLSLVSNNTQPALPIRTFYTFDRQSYCWRAVFCFFLCQENKREISTEVHRWQSQMIQNKSDNNKLILRSEKQTEIFCLFCTLLILYKC